MSMSGWHHRWPTSKRSGVALRQSWWAAPTVKARIRSPGRDILVIISASIIQALLHAGLIDDLRFVVVPVLVGGGLHLFTEGLPNSASSLTQAAVLEDGAISSSQGKGLPNV
jgi:dihydrofolate reductase